MIILMIVPMGVNAQDEKKKDKKPILKTFYDNFFKYAKYMEQVIIEHLTKVQIRNI